MPGRDVCVVSCMPAEACLGSNLCATGYVSKAPLFRCASCAAGYYNNDGPCVKCPESPAAVLVGVALVLLAAAGSAYWFDKMNVNVAFVSIGIDYMQVRRLPS